MELKRRVQIVWRVVRCRSERIVVKKRRRPTGGCLAAGVMAWDGEAVNLELDW